MGARILIIEDNPANMELIRCLLEARGHRVIAAETGEAGLRLADAERPDLILCDIQLPGMDGTAVSRRLKQSPDLKQVPVLAVTAFAMKGDRERILGAGFDGYFSKPIEPETFAADVERFLQNQVPAPAGPPD